MTTNVNQNQVLGSRGPGSLELETWRARLNASGIPAFAQTVREVASVATDRGSSAADLSDVVCRDAAMAARLIHIANSSMFNVQRQAIDTISTAIVRIGFDAVRDLALSISVIDEMLSGKAHVRLGATMAHAFHAAAQAKALAELQEEKGDEVFVAALLRDVGTMAFWSRCEEEGETLAQRLKVAAHERDAEIEVLGFSLDALSNELARDWDLGELSVRCHDESARDRPAVSCIHSGHAIATAIELGGWDSPDAQGLIHDLSVSHRVDRGELETILRENFEAARALTEKFGIAPEALTQSKESIEQMEVMKSNGTEVAAVPWESLQLRQLGTLDAIAQGLENEETRDELMSTLVSGLLDGLSAERCYFMLLNAERTRLIVK